MKKKETEPPCDKCGNPMGQCTCACPYCGETDKCTCCVGIDSVTGG